MDNYAQGYKQYKEQSVSTMTQGEMLILLYDEALKRLTRAEFALKIPDYKIFDESIQRSRDIIRYLVDTVDTQYPISQDLLKMYDFIGFELGRISASRKTELIEEIKPFISSLRDSFKEADKLSKQMQLGVSVL